MWSGELTLPDMIIAVDWDVKKQTNSPPPPPKKKKKKKNI